MLIKLLLLVAIVLLAVAARRLLRARAQHSDKREQSAATSANLELCPICSTYHEPGTPCPGREN